MSLSSVPTASLPVSGVKAPVRRRRPGALRAPRLTVGVYLVARAWQLLFLGPPVVTSDTPMYRYAGQRWLDYPSANLLGHALRPWPITLLYSVAPSDGARVLAQLAIATCCWAFCIWQVARLSRNRALAALAATAVALLALCPGVSGFDGVLLSESLTLSLVALYVGCILSLCAGRGRTPTLVVALLNAVLLGLLRPVLLPLAPIVAFVAFLRATPRHRRSAREVAALAALTALSVAGVGYGWMYNVQVDKTWGGWLGVAGLNGRTLTQYYLAAYHTPSGPSLIEAMIEGGAPACLRPKSPPVPADQSRNYLQEDHLRCPQGQAWLSAHFLSTLNLHLATHPRAAARYFSDALRDESVLHTEGELSVPRLVPGPIAALFFSREAGLPDLLVVWSALTAALVLARYRQAGRAPRSAVQLGITSIVGAGYVALIGTALLSATDLSRVALPATVLIRLSLIVVTVRSLDAIGSARGARPAPV